MSNLAPILIGIATEIGAPIVKGFLERRLGKGPAEVADVVIKSVATRMGSPVDILDHAIAADPDRAVEAIRATEADMPEILARHVESQKLANELLRAEMDKGPTWTWAWRPAWMWFLMFGWAWTLVLVPVVNAASGAAIPAPDATILSGITAAYLALYMGGHTVKSLFAPPLSSSPLGRATGLAPSSGPSLTESRP